jgi:hypothetical protein
VGDDHVVYALSYQHSLRVREGVKSFSSDPMSWHEVVGCDVMGSQKHVHFVSEGRVVSREEEEA